MKKKQLRKLIALFEFLPLAGEILSRNVIHENADPQISAALASIKEVRDDPDSAFMVKVFDEIDHNLYHLPDSRMEFYVEDILRGLADVSPFLYIDFPEGDGNDLPDPCKAALKLLRGINEDMDIDNDYFSDAAKYVLSCYDLLQFFARSFDSRCLHFNLDLCEIQERLGIYIFSSRNYIDLFNADYSDKVLGIISKDEEAVEGPTKVLPDTSVTEGPSARPFTDWLHHPNPEKLASVCKEVFDADHRQKDYAIMLCLLIGYQYLRLPEKHRTGFYDSWYAFIGKPFPKNHNYYGINKHIDPDDPFQVMDDTDPYYLNLKDLFSKKLRSCKKRW